MTSRKPNAVKINSDKATQTQIASNQNQSQSRIAGALLTLAPTLFFSAELITASAWTTPEYSFINHFISNLGVRGPAEFFGQAIDSPLFWVMNSGFISFGIVAMFGVLALRGLGGWRRFLLTILALLLGAGGVLVGVFPGTGDTPDDEVDFHGVGALACFVGGNVLVLVLGNSHQRLGLPRGSLSASGVMGLAALVIFFINMSGPALFAGASERAIVYPFLIALLQTGARILMQ